MFAFFKRPTSDKVIDAALRLISKGEKYAVTTENVQKLYLAVSELRDRHENDVGFREQYVELYRTLKELQDVTMKINDDLSESRSVEENYNLKRSIEKYSLDEWLIDSEKRRADYYAFIDNFIPLVVENIVLLEQVKKEVSKSQYQGMLLSLYTVHCDMLSLAEAHLRYYSQR